MVVELMGQQQRARAEPRRRGRRLAAGMAAADHDHVVSLHGAQSSGRYAGIECAMRESGRNPMFHGKHFQNYSNKQFSE